MSYASNKLNNQKTKKINTLMYPSSPPYSKYEIILIIEFWIQIQTGKGHVFLKKKKKKKK